MSYPLSEPDDFGQSILGAGGLRVCCLHRGAHTHPCRRDLSPRSVEDGSIWGPAPGGVQPKPRLNALYLPSQLNGGATHPVHARRPVMAHSRLA